MAVLAPRNSPDVRGAWACGKDRAPAVSGGSEFLSPSRYGGRMDAQPCATLTVDLAAGYSGGVRCLICGWTRAEHARPASQPRS